MHFRPNAREQIPTYQIQLSNDQSNRFAPPSMTTIRNVTRQRGGTCDGLRNRSLGTLARELHDDGQERPSYVVRPNDDASPQVQTTNSKYQIASQLFSTGKRPMALTLFPIGAAELSRLRQ